MALLHYIGLSCKECMFKPLLCATITVNLVFMCSYFLLPFLASLTDAAFSYDSIMLGLLVFLSNFVGVVLSPISPYSPVPPVLGYIGILTNHSNCLQPYLVQRRQYLFISATRCIVAIGLWLWSGCENTHCLYEALTDLVCNQLVFIELKLCTRLSEHFVSEHITAAPASGVFKPFIFLADALSGMCSRVLNEYGLKSIGHGVLHYGDALQSLSSNVRGLIEDTVDALRNLLFGWPGNHEHVVNTFAG